MSKFELITLMQGLQGFQRIRAHIRPGIGSAQLHAQWFTSSASKSSKIPDQVKTSIIQPHLTSSTVPLISFYCPTQQVLLSI